MRTIISRFLIAVFLIQNLALNTSILSAAEFEHLPAPGKMLALSAPFKPIILKGLQYDPADPFRLRFIVNPGDKKVSETQLRDESMSLINYFLASMTIPQDDVWVNLSPHEKNRIIPDTLAVTRLGEDLLAQDYLLKQLTSSLMFPDGEVGKNFWQKVNHAAQERFGRIDIPINTFNKVWIVPEYAQVFVHDHTVIVTKSHLKVMMQEDYWATHKAGERISQSQQEASSHKPTSDAVMREVVLPVLEKEVNEGSSFSPLRQIVSTAILAEWYKRHLKQSMVSRYYVDQHKVAGIDEVQASVKDHIYQQYVAAYTQGVFNFVREENIPGTEEVVPRKYFSGGVTTKIGEIDEVTDPAKLDHHQMMQDDRERERIVDVGLSPAQNIQTPIAPLIPGTVPEFIAHTENPYLTNMKFRVHEQAEFLRELAPNLEELLTEFPLRGKDHGNWYDVNVGKLGHRKVFEVRIANSDILGPAKGGIRYITAEELTRLGNPFAVKWQEFLKLNPNKQQVEDFIAKWVGEEAEALALGMTLKTAGLNINLGGSKGAVFMGDIVRGPSGQWQLVNWDDKKHSKEPNFSYYVARHHARQLSKAGVIGIDTDSPAPDIGTVGDTLETYNDEYLRFLTEKGEQSFVWQGEGHDELYKRLQPILYHVHEYDISQKPFLEAAVAFWQENNGNPNKPYPMPWIGAFTGKRYERVDEKSDAVRIKMGGVQGRDEATGLGVVTVMKYFLKNTGVQSNGKSVAVQAFGNVGRNAALFAARQGFKVTVINDYGITLIKPAGFSFEEISDIIAGLVHKQRSNTLYDLWQNHFISHEGVKAVLLDKNADEVTQTQQLQEVFESVIGADVDILIPAFMEGQITESNYNLVKATWIVEGANGPTTLAAEKLLIAKGKIVIPDTLANAGGVLTSGLEMKQATAGHFLGREEVYDTLEKILHQAVDNTLAQKTNDISYREAFDRVALLNIAQKQNPKLEVSSSSVGGIDLNVGQLPINETGNQNIVPWETPALNPAQWEQIKGLEPVFIRMQPINVSALLGLDNSPDPSGNLSYSMAVR